VLPFRNQHLVFPVSKYKNAQFNTTEKLFHNNFFSCITKFGLLNYQLIFSQCFDMIMADKNTFARREAIRLKNNRKQVIFYISKTFLIRLTVKFPEIGSRDIVSLHKSFCKRLAAFKACALCRRAGNNYMIKLFVIFI